MDDFETAAWEVDKNINSNQENVIEWLRNSKTATITLSQPKYITKVKKLAEKHPDLFQIVKENRDGSIVAHIPTSSIKINYVEPREYTEEEKEKLREQLRNVRKNK